MRIDIAVEERVNVVELPVGRSDEGKRSVDSIR
jgi:hypothetical protein